VTSVLCSSFEFARKLSSLAPAAPRPASPTPMHTAVQHDRLTQSNLLSCIFNKAAMIYITWTSVL